MSPKNKDEPFPWHLGVFDAHCHPTDIMQNVPSIPQMKAQCLTVMATRAQDQSLVAQVAETHGIKSSNPKNWTREEHIVPCFGWHPWFAHQMYLEEKDGGHPGIEPLQGDEKIKHYQSVLQPRREDPLSDADRATFLGLPDPTPFSTFLAQTREKLVRHPYALVGEIGLDRSFRIPEPWTPEAEANRDETLTPGSREGRRLTNFRCSPTHQKIIYKKQLQLAADCGRAVSVHGVQAHGMVHDVLKDLTKGYEREVLSNREIKRRGAKPNAVDAEPDADDDDDDSPSSQQTKHSKPFPPRVCLHSYSGTPTHVKSYFHPSNPVEMYVSFSTAINLGAAVDIGAFFDGARDPALLPDVTPEAFADLVNAIPEQSILVESDLHTAGPVMDVLLEDVVRRICGVKGWGLEEGVRKLGGNWRRFVFGG